jgi:hypothetical protein
MLDTTTIDVSSITHSADDNEARLKALIDGINDEHGKCKLAYRSAMGHAINAGGMLNEAKDLVEHGQWLPWVKANCQFDKRTAQLYMKIARYVTLMPHLKDAVMQGTLTAAESFLDEKYRSYVSDLKQDQWAAASVYYNATYEARNSLIQLKQDHEQGVKPAHKPEYWKAFYESLSVPHKFFVDCLIDEDLPSLPPEISGCNLITSRASTAIDQQEIEKSVEATFTEPKKISRRRPKTEPKAQ